MKSLDSLPPREPGIAAYLSSIHRRCNRLSRLDRDPLALVRPYESGEDREVAGFIASTLAFGKVDLILRAVSAALAPLGPNPASGLAAMSEKEIARTWRAFQYRYCFPADIISLLTAIRRARADHGSLEELFVLGDPELERAARGGPSTALEKYRPSRFEGTDGLVLALSRFSKRITELSKVNGRTLRRGLVPDPADGSACKRLFLFLRWMNRRDAVDLGAWSSVKPSRLVVPIDVHMGRICHEVLGFIPTPTPSLANALRATACFRLYSPKDPAKYDFSLTRLGIDPIPGDVEWMGGKPLST